MCKFTLSCPEAQQPVQVLGATNYTHWKDGHGVRACSGSAGLQEELQAAAIARLDTFAHVGIMEDLEGSILSLAASMGLKLAGPAWKVSCLLSSHKACHHTSAATVGNSCTEGVAR